MDIDRHRDVMALVLQVDQTALKVVDGQVEVVSEGHWRYFGR